MSYIWECMVVTGIGALAWSLVLLVPAVALGILILRMEMRRMDGGRSGRDV